MAVFRIEKTGDFTVMSNHHLRNGELSLKAKGLLSLMLSLPENWDYTTKGLAAICKDGVDSICAGVQELEKHGYVIRTRVRNANGQLGSIEYTILERPREPKREKPEQVFPEQAKPEQENPGQLNTYESSKDLSSTQESNPFPSDRSGMDAREAYRQVLMENIGYDILLEDETLDRARLGEIAELIVETVCSSRKTIRIAGDDHPAEEVKGRFLKLDSNHIRYVLDCMNENTTKIRNISLSGDTESSKWPRARHSKAS